MAATTFDDFLKAGKIETKDVIYSGMALKVRSLTVSESFRAAELERDVESGKAKIEDGTMFLIKTALVEPKLTDADIAKFGDLDGRFVSGLAQAIAAVLNPEGAEASIEKN